MSELYKQFDEDFSENIKTPEGINNLRDTYRNLVEVYDVSPDFLTTMIDNKVFAGHDVVDILNPRTTKALKQESEKYEGTSHVKSVLREISNMEPLNNIGYNSNLDQKAS